jgi:hypothetical protein
MGGGGVAVLANFNNLSWYGFKKVRVDCTEAMERRSVCLLLPSTAAHCDCVNQAKAIDTNAGYHVVVTISTILRLLEEN